MVESAEVVASYQVGQFFIKYTDKALWLIEKSSQWSLPPPTKNEEKPLVMSELPRPLPWVFFLPTLFILRLFRETISLALFLVGRQPIKPSQMVRVIQNCRRSLRAIKYHGIRNIRMKNQKKASKSEEDEKGFSNWVYNKMLGILCYKVVRYSNGKQPKAIQDRRNSGEMVVCKRITKTKKRPLSSDDNDDDDMDEMFDADKALRELASKVDLLPESDSDDTEFSLVNVSNNLDTSSTSSDDDDNDDDQPEDQQVVNQESEKLDASIQIKIQPGSSVKSDKTSQTIQSEIKLDRSVDPEKKHDTSVHLEEKSDRAAGTEKQVEKTVQPESKKPDSSMHLKNKLDSSVESEDKKDISVIPEKHISSPVQLEKEHDSSKTVKTQTLKFKDETAMTENQSVSDKIAKAEYQPGSEKILETENQPAIDNTAKNETQPVSDKIAKNETMPPSDKLAKSETQPTGDVVAKNETQPASDWTVRTENQAASSLKIPAAGTHSEDTKSGETEKHIKVSFKESELQEVFANISKGMKKDISPTHSKNIEKTSPKAASIPKLKSLNPQPETTVTTTTPTPDDTNRSAVTPK